MVFIGLLLWIAFLFVAMVLFGIIWTVSKIVLWLMDLKPLLSGPINRLNAPSRPPVRQRPNMPQVPAPRIIAQAPGRPTAETQAASDIWPKWTASYRQYVNQEKSLWQEQFDALNFRE